MSAQEVSRALSGAQEAGAGEKAPDVQAPAAQAAAVLAPGGGGQEAAGGRAGAKDWNSAAEPVLAAILLFPDRTGRRAWALQDPGQVGGADVGHFLPLGASRNAVSGGGTRKHAPVWEVCLPPGTWKRRQEGAGQGSLPRRGEPPVTSLAQLLCLPSTRGSPAQPPPPFCRHRFAQCTSHILLCHL